VIVAVVEKVAVLIETGVLAPDMDVLIEDVRPAGKGRPLRVGDSGRVVLPTAELEVLERNTEVSVMVICEVPCCTV